MRRESRGYPRILEKRFHSASISEIWPKRRFRFRIADVRFVSNFLHTILFRCYDRFRTRFGQFRRENLFYFQNCFNNFSVISR